MARNGIKNRIKSWKADDRKGVLVLVGGFFLLVASALLGEIHNSDRDRQILLDKDRVWEAAARERILSQEETVFLQQLEAYIASVSVHQAAQRLGRDDKRLREISTVVLQAFGEEVFYVEEGKLSFSLTGMGLAVRPDGTYFYGNFREGKPDGVCTAISCLNSSQSYAYSMGIWKDGQMEGLGITGSYSKGQKGEEKGLEEQVSGIFQQDRLDGWLTYEQTDQSGRSCWWEISAEEGKTCLDKRWLFQQAIGEYRLFSEKGGRAFFVVPENLLEQVWWENRVPWQSADFCLSPGQT